MEEYYHPGFKLNGQAFAYDEMSEVAYSLIKEGEPFERAAGDFLMDWFDGKDTVIQQTSGSTGEPKEIALSKQLMIHSARTTGETLKLPTGTRALNPLSVSVIAGKMMLVRAMILGWDLYLVRPESDPLAETALSFDFAAMVPLQLKASLNRLNRIGKLIVGGAPISREVLASLPSGGCEIWQTYGMTETASHIALRRLTTVAEGTDPETVLPPFKTVGDIHVSQDEKGCLTIHFPQFFPEPVHTTDTANVESDTEFRWIGRVDNVVNSGGVKLHPEPLEARMASLIPQRFFLTGMKDPELGEQLAMVVEGDADIKKLHSLLKASKSFRKYEYPRVIISVDRFLETASGKVDREKTLEQHLKAGS